MIEIPSRLSLTFTSSDGAFYDIHSPSDGKLITSAQLATESDIDELLAKSQSLQKSIASLRPFERAAILRKVAGEILANLAPLAGVIAQEGGKPLRDARAEVTRAAATMDLCAEETLRLEGEVIPMERTAAGKDHISFTMRAPIGPVLAISAFNHPLNLVAHQIGTAIASGNCVVIKPAPSTPLSAYFLMQIFERAGLPKGGIRLVLAEVPLIHRMVSSSEFGFVSFIGSARVGWELRKILAPGTRLALEHGGQAPAIVRADADFNKAIPALIKGAFYHAGQVCISTQAIHVEASVFEQFVRAFSVEAQKLIVGSAMEEQTDVGPLIRPEEVRRLQRWIDEALEKGASLVCGNKVSGSNEQYLSPTVLVNVPGDTFLMREEAFGPVVCINSYTDEQELLAVLNSNSYSFEAALFTQDISSAMRIAREIETMTLVINNHTAFRVDQMPFGGHKKSGLGMGGVRYAMEELTSLKQIIIRM